MEKQSSNPKNLPILKPKISEKGKLGCYLISADIHQKDKHHFVGDDGSPMFFYMNRAETHNLKDKLPNVALVEAAYGDTDFPVGTKIIIDHFVLQNHDMSMKHIWEDKNGKKYWKVENFDVFAGVIDGKIVPNSDILICEYLEDVLFDSSVKLSASLSGRREDVARVVLSTSEKHPVGCCILVEKYALYQIDFLGKAYAKVQVTMNDVIGVITDPSVRRSEVIDMNLSEIDSGEE